MLDLSFSKPDEIVRRLCGRLRSERLAQQITQAELAGRAGVGVNTVSNLEAGRNVGFESLIRVATVLGRGRELEALFQPRLESLEDIGRYEAGVGRQRIRSQRDSKGPGDD